MVDLKDELISALDAADRLTMNAINGDHQVHAKGERDFALQVDLQVEREVKALLSQTEERIPVLGEELAWQGEDNAERYWVVDPVDGTINYSRALPLFGTCIALVENGQATLAGISLPMLGERYLAQRGQGAWCNGERLRVAQTALLCDAMVGLGDFAVGVDSAARNHRRLALVQTLAPQVMRIRMLGSAAVQLAWLAAGRLDVGIILSNKAWDVQAGVLLAREAGALVFDSDGSEHTTVSRYTLASTSQLKDQLLGEVAKIL